jgi:hypothetical protein
MTKQQPRWTDEIISAELHAIAATLGHLPSAGELRDRGRNDLCCAITRSGGLIKWSERLNIPRLASDSDFGWQGEAESMSLLSAHGFNVSKPEGVKAPFDILVNDILRVDVKTANFATYGHSSGWFYRLGKIPQADLMFLYQADTGNFCAVPWHICPSSNVTISRGGGKYDWFINNWQLIESMVAVRTHEREMNTGKKLVA